MEVSDILKIAYELFRVKEDRFIMSCEDDRANLLRSLDAANTKIAQLKQRMAVVKQSYDTLFENVQNSGYSTSSDKRKSKSAHGSPSTIKRSKTTHNKDDPSNIQTLALNVQSPVKVRAEVSPPIEINITSHKSSHSTETTTIFNNIASEQSIESKSKQSSPRKSVRMETSDSDQKENSRKLSNIAPQTKVTKPANNTNDIDMAIDQEWVTIEANQHSARSQNGKKAAALPDAEGFLSAHDRTTEVVETVPKETKKSSGKTLRKHQSCIELPTHARASSSSSGGASNGALVQKQNQLQIAPKTSSTTSTTTSSSSRTLQQRSVSSHPSLTSSRYGESLVISGRKGLAGGVTSNKVPFASSNRSTSVNILTDTYKCVDVVRNKASRDALPGHTCEECEAFYSAMVQQGVFSPESKKARLQECSRHKSKWSPPRTPDGFWDLTVHTPEDWK